MRQKVIEPCAHLQQLDRCSLLDDIVCCDRDKCLPVWRRDGSAVHHFFTIVVHLSELGHPCQSTVDESLTSAHR